MHLLNTSVHFPGLPLIVVAEGEFHLLYFSRSELHLTWDEDATGFPLVQCFEEFIRRHDILARQRMMLFKLDSLL